MGCLWAIWENIGGSSKQEGQGRVESVPEGMDLGRKRCTLDPFPVVHHTTILTCQLYRYPKGAPLVARNLQ